jgi:5-formyltetrahydrofolate cyclo-ligase
MSPSFESYLRNAPVIGFAPMQDEPAYETFLSQNGFSPSDFLIPASKEILPEEIGQTLREKYPDDSVAVFMPGRRFDVTGTRHGRGHGWYDRLLSHLPEKWLRVGVLSPNLLSAEPLVRQSWDQPVDVLLIAKEAGFDSVETGARLGVLQSR